MPRPKERQWAQKEVGTVIGRCNAHVSKCRKLVIGALNKTKDVRRRLFQGQPYYEELFRQTSKANKQVSKPSMAVILRELDKVVDLLSYTCNEQLQVCSLNGDVDRPSLFLDRLTLTDSIAVETGLEEEPKQSNASVSEKDDHSLFFVFMATMFGVFAIFISFYYFAINRD